MPYTARTDALHPYHLDAEDSQRLIIHRIANRIQHGFKSRPDTLWQEEIYFAHSTERSSYCFFSAVIRASASLPGAHQRP
jgi:hypothetical protein